MPWAPAMAVSLLTALNEASLIAVSLGAPGWLSVVTGVVIGGAAASLLTARLWRRFVGRARVRAIAAWIVAPALLAFSLHSVAWLGHSTAKAPEIAARWHQLHPALRLAIGTTHLADRGVTVTEISRERADYRRMGLPAVRNSLHYVQRDGWVHAVDLRTRGRGRVRNALIHAWLAALGLDTLRHDGTADHLHVSLPRRRR